MKIHYTVTMPDPHGHYFEITAKVTDIIGDFVIGLPAWTPGSYKIRDFARNISAFATKSPKGRKVTAELLDKSRYQISPGKHKSVEIAYRLYADELTVRTPHLDETHGFFLGSNVLMYLENEDGLPLNTDYTVTIRPPRGWRVATSLPEVKGKPNTWRTDNYDVLADTPFEIGTHDVHEFKVRGKLHRVAFYGYGNFDADRIVRDTKKIVETQAKLFGGLPYDDYLFIHHIAPDSGGGLEHLNSCVCGWPSWKFDKEEDYERFIRLVSHEFFHTWNVKRIRPEILGPFDYRSEQHTKAMWVMEGMTQYYERLWCVRAGVMPVESMLAAYAETFDREDNRPGRKVMSLEESSWLAWTKLYQADANFVNTGVSYYSRGAQVGFLLDAKIRKATDGAKSLDDVMVLAFKRYGWPKPGFPEREFEAMCEEVAGESLGRFFANHVRGTSEIKYDEALDVYGLTLTRDDDKTQPTIGITTSDTGGSFKITSVHEDAPARAAGLQPRDELLAIDGHRVTPDTFEARLRDLSKSGKVTLSLFRRDRLVEATVKVKQKPSGKLVLKRVEKPTASQKRNFNRWIWSKK